MRCFYALLIGMLATLAAAQVPANPGYSTNWLPSTPVLPSNSPLLATPAITSTVGASNGTGYNAVGASNGTGNNLVGATNATGNNIAGASNSTIDLMSGGGAPALIPTDADIASAAAVGEWGFGAGQQPLVSGALFLERGAMLSDSAYARFGSVPITLAEASQVAKQKRHADKVRTYTNADIERVQRQSGVTYRHD